MAAVLDSKSVEATVSMMYVGQQPLPHGHRVCLIKWSGIEMTFSCSAEALNTLIGSTLTDYDRADAQTRQERGYNFLEEIRNDKSGRTRTDIEKVFNAVVFAVKEGKTPPDGARCGLFEFSVSGLPRKPKVSSAVTSVPLVYHAKA